MANSISSAQNMGPTGKELLHRGGSFGHVHLPITAMPAVTGPSCSLSGAERRKGRGSD